MQIDYTASLPVLVDGRATESPVVDQATIADCYAFAVAGELNRITGLTLSAGFLRLNALKLTGGDITDPKASSNPEAVMTALQTSGVCLESLYPESTPLGTPPSAAAIADALTRTNISFVDIPITSNAVWWTTERLVQAVQYLLAKGYRPLICFNEGAMLDNMPSLSAIYLPVNSSTNPSVGGHCVKLVGYEAVESSVPYLVKNSWGAAFCMNGYFYADQNVIIQDMTQCSVITEFCGISAQGANLTMPAPVPDSTTQIGQAVSDLFQKHFGRPALPAGQTYFTNVVLTLLEQSIVSGASATDQQFMADNGT